MLIKLAAAKTACLLASIRAIRRSQQNSAGSVANCCQSSIGSMSAEITSFSKRAAAEITRCFNGISNTVNSSSVSSSSSSSSSASTSSRNISTALSSSITPINYHHHYQQQQQQQPIKTKVVDQSHKPSGEDQNDSNIEQKISSNHRNSMGTTTTTTRQTLNNSTTNNTNNNSLTNTDNYHSHQSSHYSNQLANFGNTHNNNNTGSGKSIHLNEIESSTQQHLSSIVNISNKTITTKITTGNTNTATTTTTTTSSTTSSTSFGARTAFGGAFRVFKNSEKLLSPLKGIFLNHNNNKTIINL